MSEIVLKTSALRKQYRRVTALEGLDLEIERGMIFGLLGPNGSGKTTTLGMLLNVLKPTSGSYEWFGQTPRAELRRNIGAILEHPCFYPYMSAYQNLQVAAEIKETSHDRIDKVLDLVGLYERRHDAFKTYSLGMKQRLAIASALISDPEVLILDEPTNGLDPKGIVQIRQLITDIARMGKTIILASHLLDEVQKVCTHFMVLQKGKKLYQGSVGEALDGQSVIEIASEDMSALRSYLEERFGSSNISSTTSYIEIKQSGDINPAALNVQLYQSGISLTHLVKRGGSLEQEFLKILDEHE